MKAGITVTRMEQWLSDGQELAIFDVREHGEYGEGHLFLAVPLPYSRLEQEIVTLAPSRHARIVVYDDGQSGVAARAVKRLADRGYQHVYQLTGGSRAWSEAGYSLFEGVNVPSKTFGERIEAIRHTPSLSADALAARIGNGEPLLIVDGRPFSEYQKMNIPGSVCCPNGELSTRIDRLVADTVTPIVVNCAGRTRSIIGAQTLIDIGIKNPIYALENGTQGWMLADLSLEHGKTRWYGDDTGYPAERITAAAALAKRAGAVWVSPQQVKYWIAAQKTVYLLDVRSEDEFSAGTLPGAQHAPGGQLQQATDRYIGVRNACVVLLDSENVRAPVTAHWLRQMGHQACILEGGITAGLQEGLALPVDIPSAPPLPALKIAQLQALRVAKHPVQLWDIRSSQQFREGHIPGSQWIIRPGLSAAAQALRSGEVIIIADSPEEAGWASLEFKDTPDIKPKYLDGGFHAWQASGADVEETPDHPADAQRIDYLFFTHDRHQGNKAAARQYLEWEQGLWNRLHPNEREIFKILDDPMSGRDDQLNR